MNLNSVMRLTPATINPSHSSRTGFLGWMMLGIAAVLHWGMLGLRVGNNE